MFRPVGQSGKSAVALQMFARANAKSLSYLAGWQYKNRDESISEYERSTAQQFMYQVLIYGLSHERCLARELQIESSEFDVVTWVPTKSNNAKRHTLYDLLVHSPAKQRVQPLLKFEGQNTGQDLATKGREYSWSVSFKASTAPQSVLLIDDLWTKGSTILSSAAALLDAGVSKVGCLALGRHVNRYGMAHSPDSLYEKFVRSKSVDISFCALCDLRTDLIVEPPLGKRYQKYLNEILETMEESANLRNSEKLATYELLDSDFLKIGTNIKHFEFGEGVVSWVGDSNLGVDFKNLGFRTFEK